MNELRKALRPIRLRVRHQRLHRGVALGAGIGSLAAASIGAAGFFLPIASKPVLCCCTLLLGMVIGGVIGFACPVSMMHAARLGDAHGLQERLQTAMTCPGDSPMEQLQRQDALSALGSFSPTCLPLPSTRKAWLCAGAAAVLCAGLCLAPNPQDALVAQQTAFADAMAAAAQQVQELTPGEGLSEENQQEARKLVEDLSRQLGQAQEPTEALLAISEAEERLEALQQRMACEAQSALQAALSTQGMDALAQALNTGDVQQITQVLESLNAQSLTDASQQLTGDGQKLLQQAAQSLQAGNTSAALTQLQAISQSASAQLSQLAKGLSGLRGQAGNQSGAGAGRGTTNEDQTAQLPDTSGYHGDEHPRYRETQYERIYDPTSLEADQTSLSAQSPQSDGESIQVELGPGAGSLDGTVPYTQVAQEYAQAASQAADSQSLTQQQRQWVADYFSALTE